MMKDNILNELNEQQKKAVLAVDGPVLILAGAGSGKTKCLTHRIAYLLQEKKATVYDILAITFTNKAAAELIGRVGQLLATNNKKPETRNLKQEIGNRKLDNNRQELGDKEIVTSYKSQVSSSADRRLPWMGTFHSICVKILRREAHNIGYSANFTIYDGDDSLVAIKSVMKAMELDTKQYAPQAIKSFISGAKNELMDADGYAKYAQGFFQEIVVKVYREYQKKLRETQAMDFDDLIMKTVELWQQFPEILIKYQKIFKYILIDEYQDTNQAQYILTKLLAKKYRNICAVGDDFQCILPGNQVELENGRKNIETISEGDRVAVSAGWGKIGIGEIDQVMHRGFKGEVIRITTENAKTITLTPDHLMFAKLQVMQGHYYIYLMYRADKGYRVGVTQGVRSRKGEFTNGLFVRANQEGADKMWILEMTDSLDEALYFEQYFSYKYGIPATVFTSKGRKMAISQHNIDKIFDEIGTAKRANKLAIDIDLDLNFVHHRPQAVMRNNKVRKIINLTMFGEDRAFRGRFWHAHRINLNTSDISLRKAVEINYPVRAGKLNTWRIETSRRDWEKAVDYCQNLLKLDQSLEIVERARIATSEAFMVMPTRNIRKGMIVPVVDGGKVKEEKIESVERINYDGKVYDLSVPNLHNFVVGRIVVHNCIYGWRGANFRNLLNFEKDYPDAQVFKLERNYRSTKTILGAAQKVIEQNRQRTDKKLWTENVQGAPVTIYQARAGEEEAQFCVEEMISLKRAGYDWNSLAILYRTNAQSRIIEETLLQYNIPYRLIGALRFYERKEIKDVISFLKLIANEKDGVSIKRVINVPPRGIGEKTVATWQMLKNSKIQDTRNKLDKIDRFFDMMKELREAADRVPVEILIEKVVARTGYKEFLLDGTPEGEARWENVEELMAVASDFENRAKGGLEAFLEQVALVSDVDNYNEKAEAVTLMTLHCAKGLEFPVVFIVGMEEGLLPHGRSLIDMNELEEERRLCYVGMTRAKERLYLCYALSRIVHGGIQANMRSRFIDDVPEELVDMIE